MSEDKIEKKRGRPKSDIKLTSAERQARTRSKAHSALMQSEIDVVRSLISEMSTSNLISALPKLMADKRKQLLPLICNELINRINI